MANTLLTSSMTVHDAAQTVRDKLLVANLSNRNLQGVFNAKVGSSVAVSVPTAISASEFSSTTSASNVTETSVDVILEKHFYNRVDLTAAELSYSMSDFNSRVQIPVMSGLANAIEEYAYDKLMGGAIRSVDSGTSRNLVGTAGNEPSTHAHIVAATKQMKINKADMSQLVGVISPTAEASFKQLNIFSSADYGTGRPLALENGSLGRLDNVSWFASPDAGSDFGSTDANLAGTVLVDGTVAIGGTSITIDGFTAAAGTIKEGTQFVIENDTTIYTVTKDATKASNEVSISIYPALVAAADDGETITFQTKPSPNVIYNPITFAGAVVAPPAVGDNTAMGDVDGIQIRIIEDTSASTLSTSWVWHTIVGFKVVEPKHAIVFQG